MEPPNQQKKNRAKAVLPKSQARDESQAIQDGAKALAMKIRQVTEKAKRVEQTAATLHDDMQKTEAALHDTEERLGRVERKAATLHNYIRSTRKKP